MMSSEYPKDIIPVYFQSQKSFQVLELTKWSLENKFHNFTFSWCWHYDVSNYEITAYQRRSTKEQPTRWGGIAYFTQKIPNDQEPFVLKDKS